MKRIVHRDEIPAEKGICSSIIESNILSAVNRQFIRMNIHQTELLNWHPEPILIGE